MMKDTMESMNISDVSEKEMQLIFEWGKKWNLTENMMLKVLEQSLEDGNLDYLHSQMEKFEAWCEADPNWYLDSRRRTKILHPIANFPSSYGHKMQETTSKIEKN